MAAEYLTRKYGNGVRVSYHDLTDAFVRERSPEFIARLVQNRWALPAVMVDGELALQGFLDFAALVSTIIRKIQEKDVVDSKPS